MSFPSDMTAPPAGALPPLPFSPVLVIENKSPTERHSWTAYTAEQMREYALLAALRLREGWIPVSERLPLELPPANGVYETVNVLAFDGNYVHQMEFQAGVAAGKPWREFTNYGEFEPQNITHWMPLPAPPTADDLARVLEEGE